MKTILPFLFTCYFCLCLNAEGQNLVPNPSFELFRELPDKEGNSINRAKDWIAPKYGSDYYYKGTGKHCGTPKNIFGKQKPHSGNAYAGICTRTKFLEYVETKLLDTLIKDQEYLVEFYISRAERSLGSVKEFGVLFRDKKIWGVTNRGISEKPQLLFRNRRGYKNKKQWTKLSAVYKAKGNETVLILGHFNYDPSDDKRRMLCHYYMDDISVTALKIQNDSTINTEPGDSARMSKSEVINAVPQTFEPKTGEVITLNNVFFATNKSELLPESFVELDNLVKYLNKDFRAYIKISGHTDNTGNEEQNKILSELRAKAVAEYLISKAISSFRIKYDGYGSLKPVANNSTEEGKRLNRRVEFTINK